MLILSKRIQLPTSRFRGFTLLEVLVALLVLSIGLLGLAGLQTFSLRNNHSSFQRSQAVVMAYDALDRMRSNRDEALRGTASTYNINFGASVEDPPASCAVACDAEEFAEYDLVNWKADLARVLPGGVGRIAINDSNRATIQIRWADNRDTGDLLTVTVETLL